MAKSKPQAIDPLDDLDGGAAAPAATKPKKEKKPKASQQEIDDIFKDEEATKPAKSKADKTEKIAKGGKKNKNELLGKVLVQTDKAAKLKGDSLRANAIAPFKGNGMKYETAIAKLATSLVPKRGGRANDGASEAFAVDMVRTMYRLGFLAVK